MDCLGSLENPQDMGHLSVWRHRTKPTPTLHEPLAQHLPSTETILSSDWLMLKGSKRAQRKAGKMGSGQRWPL